MNSKRGKMALIEKVEKLLDHCKRRAFTYPEMFQVLIKLGERFNLFSGLKPYKLEDRIKLEDFLNKRKEVVYFLYDRNRLVYIGTTIDLTKRIQDHVKDGKKFDSLAFIECELSYDLEQFLLEFYKTKYNKYPR